MGSAAKREREAPASMMQSKMIANDFFIVLPPRIKCYCTKDRFCYHHGTTEGGNVQSNARISKPESDNYQSSLFRKYQSRKDFENMHIIGKR